MLNYKANFVLLILVHQYTYILCLEKLIPCQKIKSMLIKKVMKSGHFDYFNAFSQVFLNRYYLYQ